MDTALGLALTLAILAGIPLTLRAALDAIIGSEDSDSVEGDGVWDQLEFAGHRVG